MTPTEARRQFFEIITLFTTDRFDEAVAMLNGLTQDDLCDLMVAATAMYWGSVAAIAVATGKAPMEAFQEIALSMTAEEEK